MPPDLTNERRPGRGSGAQTTSTTTSATPYPTTPTRTAHEAKLLGCAAWSRWGYGGRCPVCGKDPFAHKLAFGRHASGLIVGWEEW